jgi:hypothetical protein
MMRQYGLIWINKKWLWQVAEFIEVEIYYRCFDSGYAQILLFQQIRAWVIRNRGVKHTQPGLQ